MGTGGCLTKISKLPTDELFDLQILVGSQKWKLLDDASINFFFVQQNAERQRLSTKLAEQRKSLSEKHKAEKTAKSVRRTEQDELVSEFNIQVMELADERYDELNDEEKAILKAADFLGRCQRLGPVSALHSDRGREQTGISLSDADLRKLASKAKLIEPRLKQELMTLQKQFVAHVFSDLPVEFRTELDWATFDYQLGLPPMEMALIHCVTYR